MSADHNRTPEEVRRDIEATRDELADTVAALAEKADVKGRARERVDEVKHDMRARLTGVKEKLTPGHGDGDRPAPTHATAGTAGMAGTVPHAMTEEPTDGMSGISAKAASAGQQVRSHPVPAAAIAAALLGFALGYLLAHRADS